MNMRVPEPSGSLSAFCGATQTCLVPSSFRVTFELFAFAKKLKKTKCFFFRESFGNIDSCVLKSLILEILSPVSSFTSRFAQSCKRSPYSTLPPGTTHLPPHLGERIRKSSPLRLKMNTPATSLGTSSCISSVSPALNARLLSGDDLADFLSSAGNVLFDILPCRLERIDKIFNITFLELLQFLVFSCDRLDDVLVVILIERDVFELFF